MFTSDLLMQRCIDLASKGLGNVSPNPLVGAVIVSKEGMVLGEGYHHHYGGNHAEVEAILQVEERYKESDSLLKDSILYVSLEPCSHFGKTPPCADLIISKGIKHVVLAGLDPFEKVAGRGVEKLKNAHVRVDLGVKHKAAEWMNRRFLTFVKKQRPYIILKWAESADGFMAPYPLKREQISGNIAARMLHQWRTEEDAVLVGKNTALVDNPQLNVRLTKGRSPLRVVLDKRLDVLPDSHLLDGSQKTIIFNAIKDERRDNVVHMKIEDYDNYTIQNVLYQLYLMDVQSIIVEGGVKTIQMFIEAGIWDEARVFTSCSKKIFKGLSVSLPAGNLLEEREIADDVFRAYSNLSI